MNIIWYKTLLKIGVYKLSCLLTIIKDIHTLTLKKITLLFFTSFILKINFQNFDSNENLKKKKLIYVDLIFVIIRKKIYRDCEFLDVDNFSEAIGILTVKGGGGIN